MIEPGFWVGVAVFLPALMGAATPIVTRYWFKGRPEIFVAGVSAVVAFAVAMLAFAVLGGENATLSVGGDLGIGEILRFSVDPLSLFVALIASALWLLASIHAIEYMDHEHARVRYSAVSLVALTAVLGTLFAGNLITLLIFFETVTLSCFVLVVHEQSDAAWEAGLLYIFLGIGAGISLLLALVSTMVQIGDLSITEIGVGLGDGRLELAIFCLFVLGFGIKAGLFPLHVWLPKAHPVAPSPASALLSGVVIKVGAYGLIRVLHVFWGSRELIEPMIGPVQVVMVLAMIGIFLGSAVAMAQTDIKAMLAYSSISQIGYVILGTTLLTPRGLTGGVLHIMNHGLIKSCLFLCAGIFVHNVGKRHVAELGGLGKKLPLTSICFTLAALAMIGIPPLNGFVSKWMLALGALDVAETGFHGAGWGYAAVSVLLLSSLMNLVYYGPILYRVWFNESESHHGEGHDEEAESSQNLEPTWRMLAPVTLLASGIVFFGVFPRWPLKVAEVIVEKLMGGLL